ncbi:MAG: 23S rRNA (guanosine(2251)-2'-O)-methyltransferase RlmB [Clostridiales bacterium]|nr:23S rRNA (guanosine(2251)-2'-O)-methyltransferase RlmB [Clostridiales bacterium]
MNDKTGQEQNTLIIGRNALLEALKSGREIDCVTVARGERGGSIGKIISECKKIGIPVKEADSKKLDYMCGHSNHQGVIASVAAHEYSSLEDILSAADEKGEPPFIIICDGLEDPHNLGAIIRTAEAAGAHGVIIPKRRSASLTFATAKTSAGAVEYVPVARVTNIASTIDELKKRGVWIYGADVGGTMWCDSKADGAAALVIGSEGYGLSRLVKEKCDFIMSLPMKGKINSLNASVAAGILMYEILRQRSDIKTDAGGNAK